MSDLIVPPKLELGDTVGIICPSAGVNPKAKHRIKNASKCLERTGYKVKLGKCLISNDYVAGSVEQRIMDIHEMFADKEVKAIITAIGGNHCNHLLRFIDYDLIRQNPKIFSGYSDITVLHYAIQMKANLATYYGPCAATQFAEFPDILDYTKKGFLEAVAVRPSERKVIPSSTWTDEFLDWFQKLDLTRARKQKKNGGYRWLKKGVGIGPALPACNFSVNRLAGTEFWINPDSKVVFLDLVLDSLDYKLLDASLTDLFNMGFFDNLNGLVLGRPSGFKKDEIVKTYTKILEFAKDKAYPIVAEFNLGHTDPINTIRYGQQVKIDSRNDEIILYEKNRP